ncbi:Dfp1/Him1, central region-domain-containing protein [Cytidiella melzeri]|nr:Dfp1/Him1, central region-domain-containing protein [Cytidiella melzeri]
MSTLSRNPVSSQSLTSHFSASASSFRTLLGKSPSAKRTRSPEPSDAASAKRTKAVVDGSRMVVSVHDEVRKREAREPKEERGRKRVEREDDFRVRYTRAFPNWVFYFDLEALEPDTAAVRKELEKMVLFMGARVEDFFSKDVTHLVVTSFNEGVVNKENRKSRAGQGGTSALQSPIKLRQSSSAVDTPASELVKKALDFSMKVWSADKLRSVLHRCMPQESGSSSSASVAVKTTQLAKERSLTRLLENERLHGTTERDPTQKRHDFIYFTKNSYFVLVEDIRQELQTLISLEYPVLKGRDGKERGSWPVLYCDHRARGPFLPYDEKEERRVEKVERAEQDREQELARRKARLREQERRRRAQQEAQQKGDLRRTVSMQNMRRRVSLGDECPEGLFDLEADPDSAAASGYLASGNYVAASGNSVSITSATGTTSTAGMSLRSLQLPRNIVGKLNKEVVTSRRLSQLAPTIGKENAMGPPLTIPDRPQRFLKKSRSTNTMRLPKRDEGSKPGYCESCRVKFEDFQEHIESKRHRKFADDDANFANLDHVLSRVRRRTVEEVRAERRDWGIPTGQDSDNDDAEGEDEDSFMAPDVDFDVPWDEWMKQESA